MSLSDEEFKQALSNWATGVCVVTSAAHGRMHGMSVSSFGSVSVRPKLVSVCLSLPSRTLALVLSSERLAVNVLSKEQGAISRRFSSPVTSEEERFPLGSYEIGRASCPLLHGAIAHLECSLFAAHTIGDHVLVIGEVQYARVATGEPLLFHARRYGHFTSLAS